VSLILAAVMLASMLADSPVAPSVEQIYLQGETLDYNLTWLHITGGTARMTIKPVEGDATKMRITSVAKSSPGFARVFRVHDEIETIVSRKDFSTLRYTKTLDERNDKSVEVTTIEDGVATRVKKRAKTTRVPRPVFDPISVIYYLRSSDLTIGKMHEVTMLADGKLYTLYARVTRREKVSTPAGMFDTILIEPDVAVGAGAPREEKMFIWLTNDERRLPVRIRTDVKFGSITATLRSVKAGVDSTQPPPLAGKVK
jgi:hypothetical protein